MKRSILPLLLISAILVSSCSDRNERQRGVRSLQVDNSIIAAERFTIQRTDSFTIVTIKNPWQGAQGISHICYLVRRGARIPSGIDTADVIFVPLKKIICMSTTHLAMISALNEENSISGVSGARFIYRKTLYDKVKNGQILDVGYEANLNKELIIKTSPDLIMIYGIGSESAGFINKIKELGVKTIFNADYLENDPLGKAEWIKLFGALYCKDEMADSIFRALSEDYLRIKNFIDKNIDNRPNVILGLPFKDTWFISPGNSYISTILCDAGGNYLWKETQSSESMPLGIENVYLKALNADYWLNTGSANSIEEIIAVDARLADLPCFKNGNLYNNNNRINENGGNDYWESGSLYPHLILKDIASIIHPGLLGRDELFYYRKLN